MLLMFMFITMSLQLLFYLYISYFVLSWVKKWAIFLLPPAHSKEFVKMIPDPRFITARHFKNFSKNVYFLWNYTIPLIQLGTGE